MKKNRVVPFQNIVEQMNMQNDLVKEQFEEESHMILISKLNKSDIFMSKYKDEYARKLMSRVNNYYKSIEDEVKDTTLMLINIDDTLDKFKGYLLERVKGQEKQDYEEMFHDLSFVNDVKNLLRLKSYEHKQQRELEGLIGFVSSKAKCASSIAMVMKNNRAKLHESMARVGKVYLTLADGTKQTLTSQQLNQIIPIMTEPIEDLILEQMNNILSIDSGQIENQLRN